jgi:hypothetical protein
MSNLRLLVLLIAILLLAVKCKTKKCEDCDEPAPSVPSTYNFDNVNYGGQIVRLLLLMDLEAKIQTAATTNVTKAELMALFEQNNEVLGKYTGIATGKNIKGKFLASSVTSGIKQQWLDSIEVWFDTIEARSPAANAWIRTDGVDLSQAIAKTLMGAVIYDQAVNHYLNVLTTADNSTVTPGIGTAMEHQFDEAFGYFGAARDFNSYTDAQIASGYHIDSNSDGKKDTTSEMNFKYYARAAAIRDDSIKNLSGKNYTKEIFDNFLLGRFSISTNNYSQRDIAIANIKQLWEEVIAASVIHYINRTKSATDGSANHKKWWTEMKYYYNMLRFYPSNKLQQQGVYDLVDDLLGKKPSDETTAKLDQAAGIIAAFYGFTVEQKNHMKAGY